MALNKRRIPAELTLCALAVVVAVLAVLTFAVTRSLIRSADDRHLDELATQTHMVVQQLDTFSNTLKLSADQLGNVFESHFAVGLAIDPSKTVQVGSVQAPLVTSEGRPLNLHFEQVDQFNRMTRGNATVFARLGDDFVRVTTSVKKEDGSRAVGTFLGKSHPAYPLVMKGQTYVGRATLFGKDFMTKYTPVRDAKGGIFAILYVGLEYGAALEAVKNYVSGLKIGERGHFWLVDAQEGKNKGRVLLHSTATGKSVIDDKIFSRPEFAAMLTQEKGRGTYVDENGRETALVFSRFKDWNWVVVATSDLEEFRRDAYVTRTWLLGGSLVAVVVIGVLFFLLVTRRLAPLSEFARDAELLGSGQLDVRIRYQRSDEIGDLSRSFNHMADQLGSLIRGVRTVVTDVHRAAETVAASASKTLEGAERQSDAASSAASAIEELTVSIQSIADRSKEAEDISNRAAELAESGRAVVADASEEMERIAEAVAKSTEAVTGLGNRSQQIGGIVNVIKDIADQTNLLALNAAIEAARAGEHGRGFAVVADEVRKLAERTSNSTGQISEMIAAIQNETAAAVGRMRDGTNRVERGEALASRAAEALSTIQEGAKTANHNVGEIALATREQGAASTSISQHVEAIARMSALNAQAANDVANSAAKLQQLAEQLEQSVSLFR